MLTWWLNRSAYRDPSRHIAQVLPGSRSILLSNRWMFQQLDLIKMCRLTGMNFWTDGTIRPKLIVSVTIYDADSARITKMPVYFRNRRNSPILSGFAKDWPVIMSAVWRQKVRRLHYCIDSIEQKDILVEAKRTRLPSCNRWDSKVGPL